MSVIKCNPFLLSLIIQFLLYPNLIKGNLFRQIFKEGNFWTPKMQKNLTAHTLIECGSYCIADESEFFVLNKTEKICYYGKLDETSDLLNLSMSSTIDPEKAYTLYLNLDYWEKASGKNMKLTEIKPTKPGINSHVNNLKESETESVSGWIFDSITSGPWNHNGDYYDSICSDASWFGWKGGSGVGSIITTLHENGKAILDFGNCNKQGIVVAYKNGVQIASVGASATSKIEFEFSDGDVIKISEVNSAIIQFNDLKIVLKESGASCPTWDTKPNCCTDCDINHGDCDSDSDCKNGLKCGTNNCPSEYPSTYDCCYLPECTLVEISGNSYAGCDGKYFLTSQLHGGKPIYAKYGNSRQLATYGNKWACYGSSLGGGYFVGSYEGYGYDDYDFEDGKPAEYPWKARWKDDVKVKCVLRDPLLPSEHSTTISSPNYPNNYYNSNSNSWLYSAPTGSNIILVFDKFSTESCCDFLTIYDGSGTHASQLAKLSGDIEKINISSTGNHLFLQWKTDGSAVRTGYFAYAYYKNLDVATEPIHDNCCTFPFVHKNVVYEHCIDNDHSTLWCAIETNSNGTYSKWKNCDENCRSIEHPTNIKWTYDIMLPFEKNIATEITIIDDNLLPTGYYELTFDFFSSKSCCDKLEIWTRSDKNSTLKLKKTIKGELGYLKVNWTNTAQTSLYWTTGNDDDMRPNMDGLLEYIPLNFP